MSEKAAITELRRAHSALSAAADILMEHASAEADHLARLVNDLIPLAEKELRGERYECRCCGLTSFRPFGIMDSTLCGPCHNGTHFGHEPTEEVRAENVRRWGREPKVFQERGRPHR